MRLNDSISKQLFIFFALLISIVFIVYGVILNIQSRNFLKEATKERLLSDAKSLSLDTSQFLDKYKAIVETMATDYRLKEIMEQTESTEDKRLHPLHKEINNQFNSIKKTDENIALVFISLNRANDLLTDDYYYDHDPERAIMSERQWYRESVARPEKVVITSPYTDLVTGEEVVTVSKALYYEERDIGAAALDIMVSDIYSFIESYTVGETGYSVLIKDDGEIIYHPNREILDSQNSNIVHYLGAVSSEIFLNKSGFLSYSYEGDKYLAYSDIEGTDWSILTIIPKAEALSSVDSLIRMNFTILGLTLLLSLILISLFSEGISKPIIEMSLYARSACIKYGLECGKGKYTQREDEIGDLFNAIYNMSINIESYIEDIEQKNRELSNEIEARKELQSKNDMILKVFSSSTEAMFITDKDGYLIYGNDKLKKILKLREKNVSITNLIDMLDNDWIYDFYFSEESDFIKGELQFNGYSLVLNLQKVEEGGSYLLGNVEDLTDQREKEEALFLLRNFDPLTDLYNKAYFERKMDDYIQKEEFFGVLMFNVDRFRSINEARGYSFGNKVLMEVSKSLREETKKNDVLARLGSDEFALIKGSLNSSEDLYDYVIYLSKKLRNTYSIEGEEVYLSLRLGISLYPKDAESGPELLKCATSALNDLKLKDESIFQFYNVDINRQSIYRYEIENNIKSGIENNEFELYYQPQVDIEREEVIGLEALIRWNKDGGVVSPGVFIPVAEMSKLILPIGEWVIRRACEFGKELYDRGYDLRISVNISKIQFKSPYLPMFISQVLNGTKIPSRLLELEITESILMDNELECKELLEELKDMGIMASIDDFGTGYSSLSYLKKLKFDKIKIDREFIKDIPNSDDGVIAKIIIELAESLKLDLIAEGAETFEQVEFLRVNNCKKVQGYYYSKPLPKDQLLEFLDKRKNF